MKKIMFNDRYGLTQAVLEGQKTMTRRIAYCGDIEKPRLGVREGNDGWCKLTLLNNWQIVAESAYKIGQIVAVAQRYCDIYKGAMVSYQDESTWDIPMSHPGWNNKMFVQADLMPHYIRITDVRAERLQDISDDDCKREGIPGLWNQYSSEMRYALPGELYKTRMEVGSKNTAQEAFAALIDKISGKGTWEANPWVFVYTFELVK